ncbi:hypothetical protein [Arthrobacter sp. SLBN-112]|jgi:hypothetical protein|uniref:hypothetical protein n=1 Tax=Micrococcaceae TaxID=1268 RepID=UPI0027B2E31F|nr:hypothetical protein [Arthrobacter sp. SLBN-112]MDQ0799255.1 hypothetical protein [Arthrobacter sp. SLBN-112]
MGNDLADGIWGSGQRSSSEVQELARRVAHCADRTEEVLAGFHDIQLSDWESPAGKAYRDSVSLQAVAVRRTLDRLREASAAVAAHALATLTSECSPDSRF